jgi:chromatin assembly factor 1 subunit A
MYWKPAATTGHSVKPLNNTPGHHFVDIRQQQFLQPKFPPSNLSKVSSLVSGGARLSTQTSQPLKSRVPFPPNQVEEFKAVVSGSDLTKAGLIEVLKKRYVDLVFLFCH